MGGDDPAKEGLPVIGGEPPDLDVIFGAVSYTHLRAHETVLDIVCRLLLEKKKNTRCNTRETS